MLKSLAKSSLRLLCPCILLRGGQITFVDADTLEKYNRYTWFLRKSAATWYVVRKTQTKSHTRYIRLHREITNCPRGLEVHHINRNPLDNRRYNLQICTPKVHRTFHSKILKKFA